MTAQVFAPSQSPLAAFYNKIYQVKFSRHVPLTVVLLSGVYAVYRSQHYLSSAFKLSAFISVPTANFLELLVLGASATTFIAFREDYVAQLKKADQGLSYAGVQLSVTALVIAFIALLGIAWADAWIITQKLLPAVLMTLVQFVQAAFILSFIVNSLLEEREILRKEYEEHKRRRALACPYCDQTVSLNNRARHISTCPLNPRKAP
jgi:hypothetical protein